VQIANYKKQLAQCKEQLKTVEEYAPYLVSSHCTNKKTFDKLNSDHVYLNRVAKTTKEITCNY
jgi:hypothetical protein